MQPHPGFLRIAEVITVRPGRDDDGAGFARLIGGCWTEYSGMVHDVSVEIPDILILATSVAARGGMLWTAEQGSHIVGMISTYPADDDWYLSRVYLEAGQRGTGLAQGLLHLAEDHARDRGARRMVLWSDILFTRAHAFYEKHGYVRRGGLRALPTVPDVIEVGYAKPLTGLVVEELDIAAAESAERTLARLLQDGGAAGFVAPLTRDKAVTYWKTITQAVGEGQVRLLAAWLDGALVGTLHLGLDLPEDQRHRADIRQVLVSPAHRQRGVAHALLQSAEAIARAAGLQLLVLEARPDPAAHRLAESLSWQKAGSVPGQLIGGHSLTRFFKPLLEA
jgi:GNAT superfamily N-acetyltransferase